MRWSVWALGKRWSNCESSRCGLKSSWSFCLRDRKTQWRPSTAERDWSFGAGERTDCSCRRTSSSASLESSPKADTADQSTEPHGATELQPRTQRASAAATAHAVASGGMKYLKSRAHAVWILPPISPSASSGETNAQVASCGWTAASRIAWYMLHIRCTHLVVCLTSACLLETQ